MAKFFTKKVCLIILAVVVAASGIIWAIVANLQPKFRPRIGDVPAAIYVSGNGTASVMVDDYLYFVGDSVETASIKYGDNEYYAHGKMPDTGIYRVKIVDGAPVVDYEYDNSYVNDLGQKDTYKEGDEGYNTVVTGVNDWDHIGKKGNGIEAVVPKIAGHENTAMWVFGQYLIYVSPHNRYDNRGNLLSDYLDFYRVDLNGKHHTLLYTSASADLTTDNFTVWANSVDNINLLVYEPEESEIVKINVKTKKVTTLAEDVTAVTFPKATQYRRQSANETLEKVYGGVMSYVYYTKDRTDGLGGNILYRRSISSGDEESIASNSNADNSTAFTPLAVNPIQNGGAQFVYMIKVTNNNNSSKPPKVRLGSINNATMNNYTYVEPKEDTWPLMDTADNVKDIQIYANGFCTVDGKLYRYNTNDLSLIADTGISVDTVLAVMENTIYVYYGNSVYVYDAANNSKHNFAVVMETSVSDDETTEDTTENTITLPLAVLYQPYGYTGDPMIFVQDASYIRVLSSTNGTGNYLRFKES